MPICKIHLLTVNLTKIYEFFNWELIPTRYNCDHILVLTTLKMAREWPKHVGGPI